MIRRPCTTPHKRAYDSRDDAELQRTEDGLTYGTALYPYECIAGHWHLSRSDREQLPAYTQPDPEDVARIRALNFEDFLDFVDSDVKRQNTIPDRLALRHPDNLTRWRYALKTLRARVNRQISKPRTTHWLLRAQLYRDNVDIRTAECQRLRTQATHTRAA